ncbi:hypothetical protein [Proteiniphilum sp. X52]|uniref:hypothetical protein n=1 Tax=Proteiniphilum sp. X52 TaxID=2382159 RepID=UPI0011CD3DC6|nr:hypothetical protein [Proteiniphilum sp. X52]
MKNIYKTLSAILLAVTLFSCNDGSPFSGTDNRLLSLNLTVGGQEYPGVMVSGNTINITVPLELDLNNAKVDYSISEQARVVPDPAKITEWNNEQVFNVIAYNGEKRTYIVRIIRQKEETGNTVLLATDDDVKAFAEKGISRVGGNLVIGRETGTDSVSNIDALTYLTKVDYKIIVNPTYKGKDLSGLRNLAEVGGIHVKNNKFLKTITLKSLRTVYEDFVTNTDTLREIHLPELVKVIGNMDIQANDITGLDFPSLQQAGGFFVKGNKLSMLKVNNLKEVFGNFSLTHLPVLQRADFSKLQHVSGAFVATNLNTLGTFTLPLLEKVEGDFTMENSKGLAEFYLPMLEQTKSVRIYNNVKLARIMAPKLKLVDGDFMFYGCPVRNIDQVTVEAVNGTLTLSQLTSLQNVNPFFKSLKKVSNIELNFILVDGTLDLSHIDFSNNLMVQNCSNLEYLKLPEELNEIVVQGARNFRQKTVVQLSGLKKAKKIHYHTLTLDTPQDFTIKDLKEVTGELWISIGNITGISIPDMETVADLQFNDQGDKSLKTITMDNLLTISYKAILFSTTLQTFNAPKLKEITVLLAISSGSNEENLAMQNLNGLPSLEHITEFSFRNLKAFSDYSFLKKSIEKGIMTEALWQKNVDLFNVGYKPDFQDLKEGRYVKP